MADQDKAERIDRARQRSGRLCARLANIADKLESTEGPTDVMFAAQALRSEIREQEANNELIGSIDELFELLRPWNIHGERTLPQALEAAFEELESNRDELLAARDARIEQLVRERDEVRLELALARGDAIDRLGELMKALPQVRVLRPEEAQAAIEAEEAGNAYLRCGMCGFIYPIETTAVDERCSNCEGELVAIVEVQRPPLVDDLDAARERLRSEDADREVWVVVDEDRGFVELEDGEGRGIGVSRDMHWRTHPLSPKLQRLGPLALRPSSADVDLVVRVANIVAGVTNRVLEDIERDGWGRCPVRVEGPLYANELLGALGLCEVPERHTTAYDVVARLSRELGRVVEERDALREGLGIRKEMHHETRGALLHRVHELAGLRRKLGEQEEELEFLRGVADSKMDLAAQDLRIRRELIRTATAQERRRWAPVQHERDELEKEAARLRVMAGDLIDLKVLVTKLEEVGMAQAIDTANRVRPFPHLRLGWLRVRDLMSKMPPVTDAEMGRVKTAPVCGRAPHMEIAAPEGVALADVWHGCVLPHGHAGAEGPAAVHELRNGWRWREGAAAMFPPLGPVPDLGLDDEQRAVAREGARRALRELAARRHAAAMGDELRAQGLDPSSEFCSPIVESLAGELARVGEAVEEHQRHAESEVRQPWPVEGDRWLLEGQAYTVLKLAREGDVHKVRLRTGAGAERIETVGFLRTHGMLRERREAGAGASRAPARARDGAPTLLSRMKDADNCLRTVRGARRGDALSPLDVAAIQGAVRWLEEGIEQAEREEAGLRAAAEREAWLMEALPGRLRVLLAAVYAQAKEPADARAIVERDLMFERLRRPTPQEVFDLHAGEDILEAVATIGVELRALGYRGRARATIGLLPPVVRYEPALDENDDGSPAEPNIG